ncbi:MerR family transcriptional regulator [Paenibacillus silvae]|uniref:MerR family transcriptional regulator n=1 Tax=Paenibacillus silvae TaxID=1325358 RepID=A0ABQ1ZA34_9BACL|nr:MULTISPECIES: MerR family transcriptional regulator [Paenibacillus]MCK6073501.1 MerR family transcriptional regulator [Paenibacillus silvae]MCK6149023.1 MerR family transcriptional regulator [Paenibacillus silvae]MCK6267322.1 MerR family transcriptional regulator [Paenibacillus silvae]GGH52433.1 MerR family transcriptional regulator [Paenibacillus silvae]
MHTIGEVAEMLGISAHTLRYYEKEQIIIPLRDASGDRRYNESHLKWLQFVIKLKETQMPIAVIKQYASLFQEGEHTASERLKLLEDHKKSVEQQMNTLHAANEMLELKITAYRSFIGK